MRNTLLETINYLFMIGFFAVMALGMSFMVTSDLGLHPWGVLQMGLSFHLPLSYGQLIQGIGFLCVLGGYFLKVKPSLGTVFNMFFIGLWVDLILENNLIPPPEHFYQQFVYLILGIIVFAYGTAFYISLNRGTGPRDSLMVGLSRITGKSRGLIRTYMEVTVTIVGVLFGGPLGIGTLIFALTLGFFMETGFALVRWKISFKNRLVSRKDSRSQQSTTF